MTGADLALVTGAAVMGLAGAPHCAAMCGGLSASVVGRCGHAPSFHAGRALAYAAAGAVVASGVAWLQRWGAALPALRPLWMLAQVAALALGVWLAWTGRQPAWLSASGPPVVPAALALQGWRPVAGPLRTGAAGAAWVAWPCGLLQSALVASSLASSAVSGALVMAVFAAVSSVGLWGTRRLLGRADAAWAVRLSGALLAGAAAWGLGHGLWVRVAAFC